MAGVTGCKKVSLSFELVISVFLFFSGYRQGGKKGAERLKQQLTFGSGAVQFTHFFLPLGVSSLVFSFKIPTS